MKETITATFTRNGQEWFSLNWSENQTVGDIKAEAEGIILIPPSGQAFFYAGNLLEDHLTRHDCGIHDDVDIRFSSLEERISVDIVYKGRTVMLDTYFSASVEELKNQILPIIRAAFPHDHDLLYGHNAEAEGLDLLVEGNWVDADDDATLLEAGINHADAVGVFKRKEVKVRINNEEERVMMVNVMVSVSEFKEQLIRGGQCPAGARLELVGVGELSAEDMLLASYGVYNGSQLILWFTR